MASRQDFYDHFGRQLADESAQGRTRFERQLATPQGAQIALADGTRLINLCSNNYLGLGAHPDVVSAARQGLAQCGFGLAAARLLCGTHALHHELERKLSDYLGTEESILYTSCFDANGGLFEPLFGEQDAIISDALNHASIIDGVRLCKAKRYRFANNDMAELEMRLREADAAGARFKMIATDGVFSMDGFVANLKGICDLADRYGALVMIDDSHGTGVVGATGRGSHEHCGVMGRIDVITGTLGKALGGASGGFTSGRKEIIRTLRQHSRTYLFTNALAPTIVSASIRVVDMLSRCDQLRQRVLDNAAYFRKGLSAVGFEVIGQDVPIVPVVLGDDRLTFDMARRLYGAGVFVVPMTYPVVPKGGARIRTQLSAVHERAQLDQALEAFATVGKELGAIR